MLTAARTSLWPVPVICIGLALALGILVPRIDAAVDDSLPTWVSNLLFSGGPGAARTLLDAISSSLITVTSLTFSLTVVTLQLASSQFSPRLLRTFTRDRFVHLTLGVFLGTFTYALTVQRTVRSADEGGSAFVPELSVTLAFVLTLCSVLSLVFFLAHLAGEIRVESMLRAVHADASATARAVLGSADTGGAAPPATAVGWAATLVPPPSAVPLLAHRSGFLVRIAEDDLLDAVVEADAHLVVDVLPGAAVVAETPIGWIWGHGGTDVGDAGGSTPGPDAVRQVERASRAAVVIGAERTEAQDVAFGLRQLTDVAIKALSPGINDPTTAVHALGHSSALLCELLDHDLGPRVLWSGGRAAGDTAPGAPPRPRTALARPSFADLLDLAVTQPRRYGASDPHVVAALLDLLRAVSWHVRTEQHADHDAARAVLEQADRTAATLEKAAADGDHDPVETTGLRQRLIEVRAVLDE
ncbi:DUF2254 domain-containing protein [Angustibacter speluncae]